MSRFVWLLLLILPLLALPYSKPDPKSLPMEPMQTWNPDSLVWSTVMIWSDRPTGQTMTSGVLIDRVRRRVLATRHSIEKLNPDGTPGGVIDNFFVVWPSPTQDGKEIVSTSDHYFQMRRKGLIPKAKVIAQDISRDLVLLEAGDDPPPLARAVEIYAQPVEPGTKLLGVSQPFSRGALWHRFTATINSATVRKLSYAQNGKEVALYLAQTEQQPVEFGYSGSPLVLPHNGQLVGLLLAAQVDQSFSFALISSQEIQRFLRIE